MLRPQYRIKLNQDDGWLMSRPHFHEDIEILLSLTASGSFFVGDTLYPIRAGTLFLFGDSVLHKSITPNEYQRYVLHVAPDTLLQFSTPECELLAFARKIDICCRQLDAAQVADLARRFRQLEQGEDSAFSSVRRAVWLMELLVTVFSLFASIEEPPLGNSMELERILPIMDYIRLHLSEPMPLDKLAAEFYINKYHMCRIFKTAIGLSVTEYIINCRVLKARELLRQGMRVQDVGEQVGFQNNAHFIRTFGKLTGTSPKRYAKEYQAGAKV